MTRRALELLTRLEKQALDRERLELRAIEEEIARRREAMRRFDVEFAAELEAAWTTPGGPGLFGAYAARCRIELQQLTDGLARLGQAREQAQAAVQEVLTSYKALDIATHELARQTAALCARREDATREEAALLRQAGRSELRRQRHLQAVERLAVLDLAGQA
jgi:hypothetical protein